MLLPLLLLLLLLLPLPLLLLTHSSPDERSSGPTHVRLSAVSNDGGTTFGAPRFNADLPEPVVSAGLITVGGTLYFSNPNTNKGRTHMTLKRSTDSGDTWQVDTPVWAGAAEYSNVVPLTDSTVGVVYEQGDYADIVLATITLQ